MSVQSKSTPAAAAPAAKPAEAAFKSDTGKTSSTASTGTGTGDAGKSSKEAVGGAGAVHYGFFSNVKTPEYRSGWDEIWSKKSKPKKKQPTRAREPVVISLALDDLPADLQNSLAAVVRAKLRKTRINYDKRAEAGAVAWRIDCEVKP